MLKEIETAILLGYKIALSRCGKPQSEIEQYALDLGLNEQQIIKVLEECKNV